MIPALIDKDTHVFISFGNAVLDTMSVVYHSCALLWVPLFLPRKEEEAAEKKKQEQAAAEQKQALSCTLLQKNLSPPMKMALKHEASIDTEIWQFGLFFY